METNFQYNNLPVRTATDGEDQVWFAGVDICNILDYQNATDTIEKKLDDDEKKLDYLTDSSGQRRKTWTINEFGLYSLILTSTKPEAKTFKRWVTHEVLPAIRKAGKYTAEQEQEHDLELRSIATEIQTLKNQRDDYAGKVNELKKKIEAKTSEMIDLIKTDRRQKRIEFPE